MPMARRSGAVNSMYECPISVEEWNEWRQDNLDEPEDLISLFRDGIWREMFGDEPVPNR